MKKVIAVLSDGHYALTTEATAEKNNWYLAYRVDVIREEKEKPDASNEHSLPKVGTVMYGIGLHIYRISAIEPTHVCAQCGKSNSKNRVGKKWYCVNHYNELVVTKPIKGNGMIPGRNEPCRCGSGKKYKHCCMATDRHEPRHYFNSEYKRQETSTKKTA